MPKLELALWQRGLNHYCDTYTPHQSASWSVRCCTLLQLPANGPGTAAADDPSTCVPLIHVKDQDGAPAPGFSLTHTWLLPPTNCMTNLQLQTQCNYGRFHIQCSQYEDVV